MPELSNPFGAMGGAKSWNGVDTEYKAGGTITVGQVVLFGTDGSVTATAGASTPALVAGVALTAAAAGETVRVRSHGLCYVSSITSSGPAAGNVVVPSATAGKIGPAAAATGSAGSLGVAVQAVSTDTTGFTLVFVNVSQVRIS